MSDLQPCLMGAGFHPPLAVRDLAVSLLADGAARRARKIEAAAVPHKER